VAQTQQTQNELADERSFIESVDDRMVCMMRLILALSALLIIYIDPAEPDRHVAVTYGALVLYSAYSAVLYYLSVYHRQLLPTICHWIDVGWYLLLIALSSGTSSIFFFFFFFAILVSSFHWGFTTGVRVTIASTVLFIVVGYATAPVGHRFELNRFLLRPIYLLVLGYMMAYWGGYETMLKRRLTLLKDVIKLSNPRFGVEHTIGSVMKKLRDFYSGDACLLILADMNRNEHRLYRVERDDAGTSVSAERIPAELAQLLLGLPESLAVVYHDQRPFWSLQGSGYYAFDMAKRERTTDGRETSVRLAATFEAESFVSVPLSYRGQTVGRLYLKARRGVFDNSDIEFITQVVEQVMPVIDNIRLLDRLASNAAEQERQRLARDIHDSVIQPYIGLQYRLAAIRNKLQTNGGGVVDDIERLFQITVDEIQGMRGFVRGLKDTNIRRDDFLSSVRRFARQFTDHFDIDVKIECNSEININDRLAAEVIQMIYEGLSNIRKHTQAATSRINLDCNETTLFLSIENDGETGEKEAELAPFTPGSITGRAEALGGQARVEQRADGHTRVRIEIPL
jgi:signal transduction histidine kinase